jgi:hypothetical protein
MSQKSFNLIAGLIFLAVVILHLLRIVLGWSAVIGGWAVPQWVSWLAFLVAGYLAYEGLRLSRMAHR